MLTKHAKLQKFVILGKMDVYQMSVMEIISNISYGNKQLYFIIVFFFFVSAGDLRQLPNIEPGNTLCDLFEGLGKWAIEMRTNHRAESELIFKNAGL